jgi:hypothetical protein
MGMFDMVICKLSLPYPKDLQGLIPSEEFQTKDLNNALDSFFIGVKGQLWKFDQKAGGSDEKHKMHITKSINIHTYSRQENADYWYSFELKVVVGRIRNKKLKEFKVYDNSERKARELNLKKDLEFRQQIRMRWWYATYVNIWQRPLKFLFSKFRQFNKYLYKKLWVLEKFLLRF